MKCLCGKQTKALECMLKHVILGHLHIIDDRE